jgi:hypothetical protein
MKMTMSRHCDRFHANGPDRGSCRDHWSLSHRPIRSREPSAYRDSRCDFRGDCGRFGRRPRPGRYCHCRSRSERAGRRSPCGCGRRRVRSESSVCRRPHRGSAHRWRAEVSRWTHRVRRGSGDWREGWSMGVPRRPSRDGRRPNRRRRCHPCRRPSHRRYRRPSRPRRHSRWPRRVARRPRSPERPRLRRRQRPRGAPNPVRRCGRWTRCPRPRARR